MFQSTRPKWVKYGAIQSARAVTNAIYAWLQFYGQAGIKFVVILRYRYVNSRLHIGDFAGRAFYRDGCIHNLCMVQV